MVKARLVNRTLAAIVFCFFGVTAEAAAQEQSRLEARAAQAITEVCRAVASGESSLEEAATAAGASGAEVPRARRFPYVEVAQGFAWADAPNLYVLPLGSEDNVRPNSCVILGIVDDPAASYSAVVDRVLAQEHVFEGGLSLVTMLDTALYIRGDPATAAYGLATNIFTDPPRAPPYYWVSVRKN